MLPVSFDVFLDDGDIADKTFRCQLRKLFCSSCPHRRGRTCVEEDEKSIQPKEEGQSAAARDHRDAYLDVIVQCTVRAGSPALLYDCEQELGGNSHAPATTTGTFYHFSLL